MDGIDLVGLVLSAPFGVLVVGLLFLVLYFMFYNEW